MRPQKPVKLAIYGAGGLGREIAVLIRDINASRKQYDVIGFFDDGKKQNTVIDGLKVLGGINDINATKILLNLVIAIANPAIKKKLIGKIKNQKIKFPILIHPGCWPGDEKRNALGSGSILGAGVILTTQIEIGDFVLVNLGTTIGHDVKIGSFSSIMPGASISGRVKLGEQSLVGTGARILQNIAIGAKSIVGAGAVVTKSFGDGSRLMGVPAVEVER